MKRKITMLLLAVAVCLCAAVGLTACSDNNACNHSYSEEWAFDENVHWHACTQENCTAKSNEASHFDDDKDHNCDVCGRKISDHAFENGVCNICNAYDVAGTEGIVYAYNEEAKTYTVTGYTGTATEVRIPWYYADDTHGIASVDAIADSAFYDKPITQIDVGNVTSIGEMAFEFTNLTSVTLPNSVKSIGGFVFAYCLELTSVVLSDNIETLPSSMIYTSNVQSLTLPSNLKTLKYEALSGTQLEHIVLPDSVTMIADRAFAQNVSLKSITFGKGVTKLGDNTFFYCPALTEIIFSAPIVEATSKAFYDETAFLLSSNLQTQNVTLYVAEGQRILEENNDGKWIATDVNLSDNLEFCGCTFKKILPYSEKSAQTN